MLRYILKRLLLLIPVILGVSFIIFSIMALTPGDPAVMILGEGAPIEAQEAIREELGLNDPFIVRYFNYVASALRGDFGKSYRTKLYVGDEIKVRIGYTFTISICGLTIAVLIGLPLGVLSAVKQYSLLDNATLGFTLLVTSMPGFFLAMMMILLFSLRLDWLPSIYQKGVWTSLIMPVIASCTAITASLMRMTRSTMLEAIRQDYIRTARSKGAAENRVIFGHALRNALLPVITIIGSNFGHALGGSVVIEQLFAIPGLGQLMVNSIRQKDTPMVMASVLLTAVFASVVNLIVDIAYTFVDPRLKNTFASPSRKRKAVA